jgi:sodium-dependent dicarboxylate transporter 2/3/5
MSEVATWYMHQIIFLFIGGFFLAYALEKWGLHKRIAMWVISKVGHTPGRLLLGIMLASYLLSMFILNTATTTLLIPAVLAVLEEIRQFQKSDNRKLAVALLLGLAFASSIGGTATVIGTAPNTFFMGFFNENYAGDTPITFANWMLFGLPTSLLLFGACYGIIRLLHLKDYPHAEIPTDYFHTQLSKMGKITFEEKVIGYLFLFTVCLWFFMKDIELGSFTLPGWTNLLPQPEYIKESTVAMIMAIGLFMIPSKNQPKERILEWKDVTKLPMGVIYLFGGGFALANGIGVSGLGEWMATSLQSLSFLPQGLLILCLILFMIFFTEVTSNTSSTILLLPLLGALAIEIGAHPMLVCLPVTIAASCAFMLPAATPPNTIVFGSNLISIRDMSRTGLWINLVAIFIIWLMVMTLGSWVFAY